MEARRQERQGGDRSNRIRAVVDGASDGDGTEHLLPLLRRRRLGVAGRVRRPSSSETTTAHTSAGDEQRAFRTAGAGLLPLRRRKLRGDPQEQALLRRQDPSDHPAPRRGRKRHLPPSAALGQVAHRRHPRVLPRQEHVGRDVREALREPRDLSGREPWGALRAVLRDEVRLVDRSRQRRRRRDPPTALQGDQPRGQVVCSAVPARGRDDLGRRRSRVAARRGYGAQ
mmetsp:Transcript_17273/g.56129  ORF Transcript_17273/g.56129 Transcript_17273/m.56129 type:complete len:227 (+) Transcript_17273:106-786(+)